MSFSSGKGCDVLSRKSSKLCCWILWPIALWGRMTGSRFSLWRVVRARLGCARDEPLAGRLPGHCSSAGSWGSGCTGSHPRLRQPRRKKQKSKSLSLVMYVTMGDHPFKHFTKKKWPSCFLLEWRTGDPRGMLPNREAPTQIHGIRGAFSGSCQRCQNPIG